MGCRAVPTGHRLSREPRRSPRQVLDSPAVPLLKRARGSEIENSFFFMLVSSDRHKKKTTTTTKKKGVREWDLTSRKEERNANLSEA